MKMINNKINSDQVNINSNSIIDMIDIEVLHNNSDTSKQALLELW